MSTMISAAEVVAHSGKMVVMKLETQHPRSTFVEQEEVSWVSQSLTAVYRHML